MTRNVADAVAGAPVQPDGLGDDTYVPFLGNEVYPLAGNEVYPLACPARCDPAAVWPVNQH
ncbi:hypothetical protein [Streptomyces griseoloalbus]|uniref:Uncharacterized protein n=1 Tax=Streptomyces griseoloalbus TaxID=67303 RepID=A0A7W8F7N1_9ACTN|nr:hypothetical protein [Streptomyces albaduncus]MBB5124369.1 hypothetical protein [Streptomyces albaduncus]GGW64574.1 hypothetical protein GCM10010340_48610 [Streptomyces albaduncus]